MQTYNLSSNYTVKYEKVAKIGHGSFGEVFKAVERGTKNAVALKKISIHNSKTGVPITTIREIQVLQSLKHENVVNLIEICTTNETVNNQASLALVLEFCEHDLAGLISNNNVKLDLGECKGIAQQLLNGLFYIHSNNVS